MVVWSVGKKVASTASKTADSTAVLMVVMSGYMMVGNSEPSKAALTVLRTVESTVLLKAVSLDCWTVDSWAVLWAELTAGRLVVCWAAPWAAWRVVCSAGH